MHAVAIASAILVPVVVLAPRVALARKAGQFVIVRADRGEERIPLTIGDADPTAGTITLFIQAIGASTRKIVAIPQGGFIRDVAGPLGIREALLVRANVLLQNTDEAKSFLHALQQRVARGEAQQVTLAWAYSAIGDRDRALDWLNRALDARNGTLRDSARTPQLKELRGDPRYTELLDRLARGFDD